MAGTKLVHLREVSDCNWIFSKEFLEGLNPLWKLSRDQGPANSLLRGYNLFNPSVFAFREYQNQSYLLR